jgi:hypothetical protein
MVLYYVFGQLQHVDPKALGAYALFLNNFELLQQGSFNLGHFWFIPYLFSFYILHVAMEKITRNNLTQFVVVSALFTLNAYGWSIGSSFRLGGEFSVFVYVFWAGWWLAKKGVVREIYKLKWTPLLVGVVTVTAMFFTNLWTIPDQPRFLLLRCQHIGFNEYSPLAGVTLAHQNQQQVRPRNRHICCYKPLDILARAISQQCFDLELDMG